MAVPRLSPIPVQEAKVSCQWACLLNRSDVLIIDTETTGLDGRAEILEIAILDTTGATRFHSLCLPQGRITSGAADLHGFTRQALKAARAPAWPEIHEEVTQLLSRAAVVLAWNSPFDSRMLEQTTTRYGLAMPALRWRDLLADYKSMRPQGRHSLPIAAEREEAPAGEAHRAEGDCQTVLAVMHAVVRPQSG